MSPTTAAYITGIGLYLLFAVWYAIDHPVPEADTREATTRARDVMFIRAVAWLPLIVATWVRTTRQRAPHDPYAPRHSRTLPPLDQRPDTRNPQ